MRTRCSWDGSYHGIFGVGLTNVVAGTSGHLGGNALDGRSGTRYVGYRYGVGCTAGEGLWAVG